MEVVIMFENNTKTDVQKLSFPNKKIENVFTEEIDDDSIHIIIIKRTPSK